MHRMSGTSASIEFGCGFEPLIGDLVRSRLPYVLAYRFRETLLREFHAFGVLFTHAQACSQDRFVVFNDLR